MGMHADRSETGIEVPDFDPSQEDRCFCDSGLSFGQCCGNRSPRRKPPHGVRVDPAYLDPGLCRQWVEYLEQQPRRRTQVLDLKRSTPDSHAYIEDPARVCDDVEAGQLRSSINQVVARAYRHLSEDQGASIDWFESPRILRYSAGGHYIQHADSCQRDESGTRWLRVNDRQISLLIYLNDSFTGGGLTFTRFHCHFRPRTGTLVVFPSDNRYEHRAERVESGLRYAIVSWASLTDSEKIRPGPPSGALALKDFP